MLDLVALLQQNAIALDGVTVTAEEARAQLGIALLDPSLRTLDGQDVAIYLRISDDKTEDFGGVRRQGFDAVGNALRKGAATITFYVENDTSAYRKRRVVKTDDQGNKYYVWRVIRPRWQEMLSDLRSGVRRAVSVYDIDRLARDPRDLEDAIELQEFYQRRFEGTTGSIDLNTDSGRAMARVMVVMANKQSADTARRVKRKHQEQAETGVPVGGTRPFGWQDDKKTLNKKEAAEIRKAVAQILAGVSPTAIMADWFKRGIVTPRGNPWQWAPFLQMLRNPRLAGYRGIGTRVPNEEGRIVHQWQIAKHPDGAEVLGQWDAAIPREQWDALIEKIGKTAKPKDDYELGNSRKYLLAGLARCGRCRSHPKMSGQRQAQHGVVIWSYRCETPRQGGCGGNSRSMPKVDDLIRDLVFKVHDEGGSADVEIDEDQAIQSSRLGEIDELLNDLYSQWKSKALPSADYFPMRKDLDDERQLLLKEKASKERKSRRSGMTIDVRANWKTATVDQKRAFLAHYLVSVIIHPIEDIWDEKKKRMIHPWRFNPELIEPLWRR